MDQAPSTTPAKTPPRRRRLPKGTPVLKASAQSATQSTPRSAKGRKNQGRRSSSSPESEDVPHIHQVETTPEKPPVVRQANVPTPATPFAGVFSASPAASSLPIPSFCAKLPPALKTPPSSEIPSLHSGSLAESQESQESQDDSDHGTPATSARELYSDKSTVGTTPAQARLLHLSLESPLDRIFRADREEREKALGWSIRGSEASASLSFSPMPPQQGAPARRPLSESSPSFSDDNAGPLGLVGIPPQELDGTPGRPIGPAFSTPFHQRISQARQGPVATPQSASATLHGGESTDRSEALKKYLFGTPDSQHKSLEPPFHARPSPHLQTPTRTAFESIYGEVHSPRPSDIQMMEENLRLILKLPSMSPSGNPRERSSVLS